VGAQQVKYPGLASQTVKLFPPPFVLDRLIERATRYVRSPTTAVFFLLSLGASGEATAPMDRAELK
jgi:hypothetical protein